jgi:hypothetical protein
MEKGTCVAQAKDIIAATVKESPTPIVSHEPGMRALHASSIDDASGCGGAPSSRRTRQ